MLAYAYKHCLTIKEAFVEFCGCVHMAQTASNSAAIRMETHTRLHTCCSTRAFMAWARMTQSPITHTTGEREKGGEGEDQITDEYMNEPLSAEKPEVCRVTDACFTYWRTPLSS